MNESRRWALMAALSGVIAACGGGGAPEVSLAAPTITVHPQPSAAIAGSRATFSVRATGPALTYQWYRGGIAIEGARADTLTVDPVGYGDEATSYHVEVGNATATVESLPAKMTVAPSEASRPIQACQEIRTPGSYVLLRDLQPSVPGTPCLLIRDVSGVQLDCGGHLVAEVLGSSAGMEVRNAQNFSIKNCRLQTLALNVRDSTWGSLSQNHFPPSINLPRSVVNFWSSRRMTFDGNTISEGAFQQFYGEDNTISNNQITADATVDGVPVTIISARGRRNRIIGNTLDGSARRPLSGDLAGATDGVGLSDETDVAVMRNTMRDFVGCGISVSGTMSAARVWDNHVTNASCGFGGQRHLSLLDSSFMRNTIEGSVVMFTFGRMYGLRPQGTDFDKILPADTAVAFKNNLFEGNTLLNPHVLPAPAVAVASSFPLSDMPGSSRLVPVLPGERPLTPADFQLSNNVFRNNDFGRVHEAPWFGIGPFPAGMVVDGGANRCRAPTVARYPIQCN